YNPIKNKEYHKAIFWAKCILVLLFAGLFFMNATGNGRGKNAKNKPPLYGVWEVEEFSKNGDTLPPILTNNERWRYLIIENKNNAVVKTMDNLTLLYKFEIDTLANKIKIRSHKAKYNFKYKQEDLEFLVLEGNLSLHHII